MIVIVYACLLFGILMFFTEGHQVKKWKLPAVISFVLFPMVYFLAVLKVPYIYNRQGQATYKKYIERALGRNVVKARDLECYCVDCRPANKDLNVYCLFEVTPEIMTNISADLELEQEAASLPPASLGNVIKLCGGKNTYTQRYAKAGYDNSEGVPAVFYYNDSTQEACVQGWFPSGEKF